MLSLETIDRTIFELLRTGCVSYGILPDWRVMVGTTLQDKQAAYESAKTTIRTTKEIVEVFGIGSAESRDAKLINRITMARKSTKMGNVGASGVVGFEKRPDGNFNKFKYPDSTVNIAYEIRTISKKTQYERIMSNIVSSRLGRRTALKSVDSNWHFTGEDFLIEFAGAVNVSSTDFIEWIFNYNVLDVWLDDSYLGEKIVPALTTINIKTYLDFQPNDTFIEKVVVG